MGRDTETDVKRMPTWKIVVTVLGALTGLVAAAAPGTIEYLDKAEERAQAAAEASTKHAQKSGKKADLAYKLLRQRIKFLDVQISDLKRDSEHRGATMVQILLKLAENAERGSGGRRYGAAPMRRPASASGGPGDVSEELEDLLGIEVVDDGGGEGAAEEGSPEPPVQQQLPMNLEQAWVEDQVAE